MIVDHLCGNCAMRVGAERGLLIGRRSECALFCEKVFWKGEGGGQRRRRGCETLKANRNIVSKKFLEVRRGFVGGTLATDFPLSRLSFNFAVAVQFN
ncbi:hypothetical protein QQF64_027856 [Cirrhinus molitorella]|uniref:Uncharacterized protein n=1 Tax=Cirrhinus molitorella TaxID=172907 RepID=A0ABR3NDJ8_9TELE